MFTKEGRQKAAAWICSDHKKKKKVRGIFDLRKILLDYILKDRKRIKQIVLYSVRIGLYEFGMNHNMDFYLFFFQLHEDVNANNVNRPITFSMKRTAI